MSLADEGLFPAGAFWCPRCFCTRDFVIAVDEEGTVEEEAPPLECFVCGYVHGVVIEECDPKTGCVHESPVRRPAITLEQREAARTHMRRQFVQAVTRDGARRQNFTRRARRR